jgi:hypothetical protein
VRGHLQQRSAGTWRLTVYVGRSADGGNGYVERTVRGTRRKATAELAVEAGEGRYAPDAP